MITEHDDEPIPGLPAVPPEGERILWQGSPNWRGLALRSFHVRKVAFYFAVLVAWTGVSGAHDGNAAGAVLTDMAMLLPLGAAGVALLALFGWMYARTTIFTITSRRVVMRFGIALPMTVNLPFKQIEGAELRRCTDGTGDLALQLAKGNRAAYFHIWPFVRPWRITRPQPLLRALVRADEVAETLAQALSDFHQQPAAARPAAKPRPADADAPSGLAPMPAE